MSDAPSDLSPTNSACSCKDRPRSEITWTMHDDELQQGIQFTVGYNCEARGPRSHGVHGMEITWYLRGPKGAAQFRMGTRWTPGKLALGHGISPSGVVRLEDTYPSGYDVGYHAYVAQYPEQSPMDDCHLLGQPCYYDGSGLQADDLVKRFIEQGEPAIWAELRAVYERIETVTPDE